MLTERDLRAGQLAEALELVQGAEGDPDVQLVRELGADPARRLAGRAGRERLPLEQDDVLHAQLAKVERGARSERAAPDDDHVCLSGHLHARSIP